MRAVAGEMNLPATAFVAPRGAEFDLRCFAADVPPGRATTPTSRIVSGIRPCRERLKLGGHNDERTDGQIREGGCWEARIPVEEADGPRDPPRRQGEPHGDSHDE